LDIELCLICGFYNKSEIQVYYNVMYHLWFL